MASIVDCTEYYPFDSGDGANSGESRWAIFARLFRDSGVVPASKLADISITTELDVYGDSSGMLVKIRAGIAFIQGFIGRLSSQTSLDISSSHSTYDRIDLVVARLSRGDNKVYLAVVEGTAAADPVCPSLTQNSTTWEIPLAQVLVGHGVTTIAAGAVSDRRTMSIPRELEYIEAASDTTAKAGCAYIATSAVLPVDITLPISPTVGDSISVIGNGAGGWTVTSNALAGSQSIVFGYQQSEASSESAIELMGSSSQYGVVRLVCVDDSASQVWAVAYQTNIYVNYGGNYFGDGSDGNVTISSNTELTSSEDSDMVVKNYETLTINAGCTLTAQNRCKGLLIYVRGNCSINGTLSMSGKGGYVDPTAAGVSSTGIRLPMLKSGSLYTLAAADFAGCGAAAIAAMANQPGVDGDGKIYTNERYGGAGGTAPLAKAVGGAGGTLTNGSGGGGSGGISGLVSGTTAGDGGGGTCFGGGAGGGGYCGHYGWTDGYDGAANSGPGGDANPDPASAAYGAGGGAGNDGGAGTWGGNCHTITEADDGTGGFLILIVGGDLTIGSGGVISADGTKGGNGSSTTGNDYVCGGGGSGGGTVWALYAGTLTNNGTVRANGGTCYGPGTYVGGAGGAGTVVVEQVDA